MCNFAVARNIFSCQDKRTAYNSFLLRIRHRRADAEISFVRCTTMRKMHPKLLPMPDTLARKRLQIVYRFCSPFAVFIARNPSYSAYLLLLLIFNGIVVAKQNRSALKKFPLKFGIHRKRRMYRWLQDFIFYPSPQHCFLLL